MAQSFREIIGVSPSQVSIQDSILLIIDAQNEYKTGLLATKNISSTSSTITHLLTRYREASAPIIHITHTTPAGAPVFRRDHSGLADIFDSLTPKNGEVVVQKEFPGSFTDTTLEGEIKKTGRKQVVLVGYMAHVCVSTTARQAAERGYDVVVVEDAVGDRDIPGVKAEDLVRVVLAELEDAFATVVKAADVK